MCFLQASSGLDRESATERDYYYLETSSRGIFPLHNALLSTNFGSTGRIHYFSAVHKVRAHASYMGVSINWGDLGLKLQARKMAISSFPN